SRLRPQGRGSHPVPPTLRGPRSAAAEQGLGEPGCADLLDRRQAIGRVRNPLAPCAILWAPPVAFRIFLPHLPTVKPRTAPAALCACVPPRHGVALDSPPGGRCLGSGTPRRRPRLSRAHGGGQGPNRRGRQVTAVHPVPWREAGCPRRSGCVR